MDISERLSTMYLFPSTSQVWCYASMSVLNELKELDSLPDINEPGSSLATTAPMATYMLCHH